MPPSKLSIELQKELNSETYEAVIGFDTTNLYSLYNFIRTISMTKFLALNSAIQAQFDANNYLATPFILRGILETTVLLLDTSSRIDSFLCGNTRKQNVVDKLFDILSSTRSSFIKDHIPGTVEATNILTAIKNAEKFLAKIANGKLGTKNELSKVYDLLSEVTHPNFQSNAMLITKRTDGLKTSKEVGVAHKNLLVSDYNVLIGIIYVTTIYTRELLDRLAVETE